MEDSANETFEEIYLNEYNTELKPTLNTSMIGASWTLDRSTNQNERLSHLNPSHSKDFSINSAWFNNYNFYFRIHSN